MPHSGSHAARSTNWKPGSVGSKPVKRRSETRKVAALLAMPTKRHTGGGRPRAPSRLATPALARSTRPAVSGRKVTIVTRLDSSSSLSLAQQVADEGCRADDHEQDVALREAALGVLEAVGGEALHAPRQPVHEHGVDEPRVDHAVEHAVRE